MKRVFRTLYRIYAVPVRIVTGFLILPRTIVIARRMMKEGKSKDQIRLELRSGILREMDKKSGTYTK